MKPTVQEQEDLIERLQWHDDDYVMQATRNGAFWKRYQAARQDAALWREGIAKGYVVVLAPFLSSDGILISIKN